MRLVRGCEVVLWGCGVVRIAIVVVVLWGWCGAVVFGGCCGVVEVVGIAIVVVVVVLLLWGCSCEVVGL